MFDKIIKISLIVLGIIFLVLYYQNSQSGRFQHVELQPTNVITSTLDTRTGITYIITIDDESKQWICNVVEPRNSKATRREINVTH